MAGSHVSGGGMQLGAMWLGGHVPGSHVAGGGMQLGGHAPGAGRRGGGDDRVPGSHAAGGLCSAWCLSSALPLWFSSAFQSSSCDLLKLFYSLL